MGGVRKAFMQLAGKPLLQHSVDAFRAHPAIHTVVVAVAPEDLENPPGWLNQPDIILVKGGAERADSVLAGVAALPADADAVIVHDAARPLVNADLIDRVLNELQRGKSVTLAIQVTDTLHEVDRARHIRTTPDRQLFWRAQTPQAFPRDVLESALRTPDASRATDEAGLVASCGWHVGIVPGEAWNIKVTTPDDIALAESALASRSV
jgi:2-C-methyl-D-erythritol 4-phosphate cytidylyltransferase